MYDSELLFEKLKKMNKKLEIDGETRGVNYYTARIEELYNENLKKIVFDDNLIEDYKRIRKLKNYDENQMYIAKEMFKLLVLADVEIEEDLILIADMVYLEEYLNQVEKQNQSSYQKIKTRRI